VTKVAAIRLDRAGTGHRAVSERLLRHRARVHNFSTVTVWTRRHRSAKRARGGQNKGQRSDLESFIATLVRSTQERLHAHPDNIVAEITR
jgi:hypothetical protein